MQTQVLAVQAKCSGCGKQFELSYGTPMEVEQEKMARLARAVQARLEQRDLLCYECRE